ncbi:nucleotidyltransferase domain-containing protein [Micromonospora sp. CA-111912]|uniref:nucleotidyltransferase domain-containing protein n=1 Tax=Micromonospora sp. CA-111912 TaxID=3239955 RepID=UPI003D8B09B0
MANVDELSALTAAERLADLFADTVGADVRSVILHGSLSAGDFRAGSSDIDLLIVIEGGLSDAQSTVLERLVRQADLGSAAGIDVHVVTAEIAGAPSRTPALELYIGRYDRSSTGFEVERRVAASPDLPAELSMARADGRSLRGAPPREVIAPVPPGWIVDRGRHWLMTWRSLTDDTENAAFMALTACRIWRFAVDNVHCSKAQAARWALDRDPSLTVVRQAVQQYEQDPTAIVGEQGITRLIDTVLQETAPTWRPAEPASVRHSDVDNS